MYILILVSSKFLTNLITQIRQWKHWEDEIQKDVTGNGTSVLFATHILVNDMIGSLVATVLFVNKLMLTLMKKLRLTFWYNPMELQDLGR